MLYGDNGIFSKSIPEYIVPGEVQAQSALLCGGLPTYSVLILGILTGQYVFYHNLKQLKQEV